jgi:hypothetical protein
MLYVAMDRTASTWWWLFPQKLKGRKGWDKKDSPPACLAESGFLSKHQGGASDLTQ